MPTETTNDDLAHMIKTGFDGVDDQFRKVNTRFDRVDQRLDRIENIILKEHDRRIARIEEALALPKAAPQHS